MLKRDSPFEDAEEEDLSVIGRKSRQHGEPCQNCLKGRSSGTWTGVAAQEMVLSSENHEQIDDRLRSGPE